MIRLALVLWIVAWPACAETLRMAVTTSFQNSGLSDVLLPAIERDTGIDVQLLVVGTGQALRLGRAGDVDAVLVHSRAAEDAFVAAGYAPYRRAIMANDFVLVGPRGDPAGASEATTIEDALAAIAAARSPFVSRGDDSGTHRKELALWPEPLQGSDARDPAWYREAGSGMGATLNTAIGLGAYTLADRASWGNFKAKRDHAILFEGEGLENPYAFLPVSRKRHSHVKSDAAARVEAWLTSPQGRALIDGYRVGGEQVFRSAKE